MKKAIKKIIAIGLVAGLAFGALGCSPTLTDNGVEVTAEYLTKLKADTLQKGINSVDITMDNADVVETALVGTYTQEQVDAQLVEQTIRDAKVLADYKDEEEKQKQEDITQATADANAYEFEDVGLNSGFTPITLTDRDLSTLGDGEIKFDGEEYDFWEELTFSNGLNVDTNDVDFDGNAYLTIPEDGIEYTYKLDTQLKTHLIGIEDTEYDEDETLKINFLGKDLEISKWTDNIITFTSGTEHFLKQGETITVNGKEIQVKIIGDDYIYVQVDGTGKKITEEKGITEVNGIDIEASEILYIDDARYDSYVTIKIGTDIENIISNTDEYAEDSEWEYVITDNSIGIKLIEDFVNVGDDEEFEALGIGMSLALPNEYVTVTFGGLVEEDSETYKISYDENDGYTRIRGEFVTDTDEYENIYVADNGTIFDDNDFEIEIIDVRLGDTNILLDDMSDGIISIKDLNISLDLSDAVDTVNTGVNLKERDDDYTTNYGIVIENPEDDIEDKKLTIIVPEEKVEATISVV